MGNGVLGGPELDKLFCMNSKKYGIEKLLLKAIAVVESSMNTRAYRYEPGFWSQYLATNPEWMSRDPHEVSASYGLMQIMFTTAWMLGFRGSGEDLYDPVINIELGAKLLRQLLDQVKPQANIDGWALDVALARYNGGGWKNPAPDGTLRNTDYIRKVRAAYWTLRTKEENCVQ